MGFSFRLTARVLLYAPSHSQDSTYHGLCYTSRGAHAGIKNSSMGSPWRINPTTHRTMSKRSYHGATSRSEFLGSPVVETSQCAVDSGSVLSCIHCCFYQIKILCCTPQKQYCLGDRNYKKKIDEFWGGGGGRRVGGTEIFYLMTYSAFYLCIYFIN